MIADAGIATAKRILKQDQDERRPPQFKATFADGTTVTTKMKGRGCRTGRHQNVTPTHAWRAIYIRPNGTVFEQHGFSITKGNAARAIINFTRTIAPRKPTKVEIAPCEPWEPRT